MPKLPAANSRTLIRRLVRVALAFAAHRQRGAARKLTEAEIASLLQSAEDTHDLAHETDAQSEALAQALAELPERRRAILVAALQDKAPWRAIAKRLGVSMGTVNIELRRALEHGARRLRQIRGASDKN
ncbi:sigma-70 family RNA polymerase sigma factor [Hyphomicrobium album]|uniref:sigma-70 family RNA polymerase sigma factor n=1 Tax=Hyphomicrobium album TaxID=2665159 RepID=UPI0018A8FAE1|nr:sigma-70 family RNA polymerase sigma factor [Hyphomicrobium album]